MGFVVAALALGTPKDADACGACYAAASESTVVNDHKMALAISKQRTILWDQISYAGNPSEFAYVVPARPGTIVEASHDAWFSALDVSSRPILMAPQGYGGGGYDEHGGCGCGGFSSESAAFGGSSSGSREPVEVVSQKVTGPYETVTLRSQDAGALNAWLRGHGFAIPAASDPIIADYVKLGFDFVALRLRPGADVRSIQPIRILSSGADPTLPLRMMQIGASSTLGITLWVIGEGRWHTANFPDAKLDFDALIWDFTANRSNYQELSRRAMAAENGRAILTEYSDRPNLDPNAPAPSQGMASNQGLASAYKSACAAASSPVPPTPTPVDSGTPDASKSDAASDAGDDAADADAPDAEPQEAGVDASPADASAGADASPPHEETKCDDLDLALEGLVGVDVKVTRLRANLPYAALNDTFRLEPAPSQDRFENVHYAKTTGTIQARVAKRAPWSSHGTYAVVALTVLGLSRLLSRKKKP